MPACKVCGHWFVKIKPKEELCDKCECALCRLSCYVAPVVRCKECKYSYADLDGLCCTHGVCIDSIVPEDFYCANGERRGGADNG